MIEMLDALDALLASERSTRASLDAAGHPIARRARLLAALALAPSDPLARGKHALDGAALAAVVLKQGAQITDVDALIALRLVTRQGALVWVPAMVRERLASGVSAVEVVRAAERSTGLAAGGVEQDEREGA